jgi:hypothetical protein
MKIHILGVRLLMWLTAMFLLAGCNRLGVGLGLAHQEQNETSHSKYYIFFTQVYNSVSSINQDIINSEM